MFAAKHGISVCTPFVRHTNTMDAVLNVLYRIPRTFSMMKLTRNFVRSQTSKSANQYPSQICGKSRQARKNAEQVFSSWLLSPCFYLEWNCFRTTECVSDTYSLFTRESFHSPSLSISKMLNKYLLLYISYVSLA